MKPSRHATTVISVLATIALVGSAAAGSASAGTPQEKTPEVAAHKARAKAEATKVDKVRTPRPDWFDCSPIFGAGECATVELPLDYDKPNGPTTGVAVLRIKAADQKNKIGTLFLNPGGPGGSGVDIASAAPYFLGEEVLERFDIVGFDPRGTNYSANVQCWENVGEQAKDLSGMNVAFPFTAAEEKAYVASSKKFGKACATEGTPLSASMSTAEVARDMDVLRRMVGDKKLSYLGFSYGSYLGNVYANMFPERVRAVAIDGVIDPVGWAGTSANAGIPQTARIRSGEGAAAALDEILERCGEAGEEYCSFASTGDPKEQFDAIVAELKTDPIVFVDEETGEEFLAFDYATLISWLLGDLYYPDGYAWVDMDLSMVRDLLAERAGEGDEEAAELARATFTQRAKAQTAAAAAVAAPRTGAGGTASAGFPYYNGYEAFQSVLCTDGLNPAKAEGWPGYADAADAKAPGFGPLWTWASAPCASKTWTAQDEDAYRGAFTAHTANPVLVVGNYWDPATNYKGAVKAAALLSNSALLLSDNWGHTAYGTSECATDAVDQYLLTLALPDEDTVCVGDVQPFTEPLEEPGEPEVPDEGVGEGSAERRSATQGGKGSDLPDRLPPVVPPLPGEGPRY